MPLPDTVDAILRQIRRCEMATKRKRAKGGGAKPKGPLADKTKAFSTRITAETRRALETEKKETGHSISQIAERWIMSGLREKRARERTDPVRALCYVVAELSGLICNMKGEDGKPAFDWRTDPFMFRAYQLAIQGFMDTIAPSGDVVSPAVAHPVLATSTLWGPHDSPEKRAEWAVTVLTALYQTARGDAKASDVLGFNVPADMEIAMERDLYGMADARAALTPKGR
jgi:hypothetical protein